VPKIMQERRDNVASRQGKENTEVEEYVRIGVVCHNNEQGDRNRKGSVLKMRMRMKEKPLKGMKCMDYGIWVTTYIPGSFATADRATFALSISLMSLWSVAMRPLGSLT
jgi:hypothetical protein